MSVAGRSLIGGDVGLSVSRSSILVVSTFGPKGRRKSGNQVHTLILVPQRASERNPEWKGVSSGDGKGQGGVFDLLGIRMEGDVRCLDLLLGLKTLLPLYNPLDPPENVRFPRQDPMFLITPGSLNPHEHNPCITKSNVHPPRFNSFLLPILGVHTPQVTSRSLRP